jgi:hypothetical protein
MVHRFAFWTYIFILWWVSQIHSFWVYSIGVYLSFVFCRDFQFCKIIMPFSTFLRNVWILFFLPKPWHHFSFQVLNFIRMTAMSGPVIRVFLVMNDVKHLFRCFLDIHTSLLRSSEVFCSHLRFFLLIGFIMFFIFSRY